MHYIYSRKRHLRIRTFLISCGGSVSNSSLLPTLSLWASGCWDSQIRRASSSSDDWNITETTVILSPHCLWIVFYWACANLGLDNSRTRPKYQVAIIWIWKDSDTRHLDLLIHSDSDNHSPTCHKPVTYLFGKYVSKGWVWKSTLI